MERIVELWRVAGFAPSQLPQCELQLRNAELLIRRRKRRGGLTYRNGCAAQARTIAGVGPGSRSVPGGRRSSNA
ncbi:MAG: hypothetical protein KGJ30_14970, partial [Burkholderiales bacterium]|nr:hypothetical protein [Burkholderiales bacterium]